MSWTRGLLAVLAVCVLLVTGSVSCGTSGAQDHKDGQSVSPVGKVLGNTDHEGRHYREVDQGSAPDVGIEVQPGTDDCWSVRLDVENFVFSPTGTTSRAVSGHGVAVLFVDGHPVTTLRTPAYRLDAGYVPQGTHKVTARLYADDGTVWAVDGDPIESTADVTASEPRSTANTATAGTDGGSESQSMTGAGGDGTQSQLTTSAGAAWIGAATQDGRGCRRHAAGQHDRRGRPCLPVAQHDQYRQRRLGSAGRGEYRRWPVTAPGSRPRTRWQGSPDHGGKAS